MSSFRAPRFRSSRVRAAGAAVTVVLAALSLTACDNGKGVEDEGASTVSPATSGPAPEASGSTGTDEDGKSAGTGADGTAGSGTAGTGSGGSGGSKPAEASTAKAPAKGTSATRTVTCEGSNTKTVASMLSRPVNHMLLKVTNTGGSPCYLYHYPAVRFGQSQSVPPVIEDSQPQAVVTLAPGESGYASVNLSAADGSGKHGYTAKSLDVYFYGRDLGESVGKGAHPSLPANGVHVDDSLKVTYWQQDLSDAISW